MKSFATANRYDKQDRKGPKIFVGEWATREGDPTPNLEAALADAAWLTGLERNSDLIMMESYAPLFVNVNPGGMQWATDLIGYNALTSYGSPSYWVQVMFSGHLGTEVVSSTLANTPARIFESVTRDEKQHKLFVKVVNGTSDAQPLAINLEGAGKVPTQAKADHAERQNAQRYEQHHEPQCAGSSGTQRLDRGVEIRAELCALFGECAGTELLSLQLEIVPQRIPPPR